MQLCEDTLAHSFSAPAATHWVVEGDYGDEYAVCTSCMEFLTNSSWINVELVSVIAKPVGRETIKGESLGVVQSTVTVKPAIKAFAKNYCFECGGAGTLGVTIHSLPWFKPNAEDDGNAHICDSCYLDSKD